MLLPVERCPRPTSGPFSFAGTGPRRCTFVAPRPSLRVFFFSVSSGLETVVIDMASRICAKVDASQGWWRNAHNIGQPARRCFPSNGAKRNCQLCFRKPRSDRQWLHRHCVKQPNSSTGDHTAGQSPRGDPLIHRLNRRIRTRSRHIQLRNPPAQFSRRDVLLIEYIRTIRVG
jgi:hypothetical protein